MAAALELLPDQMLLYLVEAGETFTGTGLTTPVTAAVAGLVIEIAEAVTGRMAGR